MVKDPIVPADPQSGYVPPSEIPSAIGDMTLVIAGTPAGLLITLTDNTTQVETSGLFDQDAAVAALAQAGILAITPAQFLPVTRGTDGVLYAGNQPLPTMDVSEHLMTALAHASAWKYLKDNPVLPETDVQYVINQVGKKTIKAIGDIPVETVERVARAILGSGAVQIVQPESPAEPEPEPEPTPEP